VRVSTRLSIFTTFRNVPSNVARVFRVCMVGSGLSVYANNPQDRKSSIYDRPEKRIPAVHDEHHNFAKLNEHGEDGNADVEIIQSARAIIIRMCCRTASVDQPKRDLRLTPNKCDLGDFSIIGIGINNLIRVAVEAIVISDLP
jgi:hypothetical protein